MLWHCDCKGVDIFNGEYPPGVFLRGLKFSDKKIGVLKFLGEKLRGLKSISKFDQFIFQNFYFLQIQTSQKSLQFQK